MRSFKLKLLLFFGPIVALFSLPALVLGLSLEACSADFIAERHFSGPREAVYGPAYTNPDARYKLASAWLHRPRLLAMGSSRALELTSDLFTPAEGLFYNAGLLTERLFEFRRALAHLPMDDCKGVILVLDQWNFNPNWPNHGDNPLYERELAAGSSDVLNALQHGLWPIWRDLGTGYLDLGRLVDRRVNLGVSAKVRGNGFRWDGSYSYADVFADPENAKDYKFRASLGRVAEGSKRYEFGDTVDPAAVEELTRLLAELRRRDIFVVAYLPPYAPTVERALKDSGRHTYLPRIAPTIAPLLHEARVPFIDFTSCESIGCRDDEFVDGVHPGTSVDARILIALADAAPWLDPWVDQAALQRRIERAAPGPELPALETSQQP